MTLLTRTMLPVVKARRRPNHREVPLGGRAVAPRSMTPTRTLAVVAVATLRRARRPEARPASWTAPAFAREVDLIRLHLAPIRSRLGLAASFGREAFQGDVDASAAEQAFGPVTVAYALRWLELGDGIPCPPWLAWLDAGPGGR